MPFLSMIIAAAGRGRRLGREVNKVFLPLAGKPMLAYSLAVAAASPLVDEIIIVTRPDDIPLCRQVVAGEGAGKVKAIVAGGAERQDSIAEGLKAVARAAEWVAVHDGARPFLTPALLEKTILAARTTGAAIAALPVKETIKQGGEAGIVAATLDRKGLWSAQTPQVFRREWLVDAYREAAEKGWQATDDAALVERLGYPVKLVPGEETNIKITTPGDLVLAGALLAGEK
ncbi:2-C-methyl-D-erythritol 4-phosphate cytidylyltransferase [Moorella thermoacetica]|uniref:2-C-methyl-D-erythritol 4-phosphate cytidylyltransferase n=3 Tax=Neomoorella thermoacetica TaxID=1525 RepID=A0A1J5JRT6_NEOTH|nr:2-C-methyl-D-erythritol 4-phosphate cytidylyltransferase [Moorella thermoacetica]OIQ10152.1 2-C-methyl-D-erythritol 4-phosphate cytidylyltransferase [Moorella thermoacetica]OIQ11364.1 2-C-methyl-D-erythritol 4-phosphate cytidylyltransferase [Moorella thermoacetica]OIQ62388.1 2-C-methyl-D-erythritol 4-phosphate cytidylyltransferase [Moorella thermoacetica]GAF25724.1 4-diphosphocytidyl-2-methyl-D-erithritol synthase [Moorella thermoacetica Y72]